MINNSNYNFFNKSQQIKQMFPAVSKNSPKSRKQTLFAIEAGMAKISEIKEIAKIELNGKLAPSDLNYWRQTLTDEVEVCKRAIKWLKKQDAEHPLLSKLNSLKIEIQILDKKISEQENLMKNREQLYGSRQLQDTASFDQLLNKIIKKYPDFETGCLSLQDILKRHMHVVEAPLTYSDLNRLKIFHRKIAKVKDQKVKELSVLVKHEIDELESTFERKKKVLKEISLKLPGLKDGVVFDEWPVEEKMAFYVNTQQVFNHPFEAPIDFLDFQMHAKREDHHDPKVAAFHALCRLVEQENQEVAAPKKDFWDFVHLFDKKAHQLAKTKELKTRLYELKIEGLKSLLANVKNKGEKDVLVIGGGPGGFMKAFALGFAGHRYQLIEKRASDSARRSNVITFGKGNPRDLSILSFLGILSAVDKDEKGSFGHLKPNLLEIQIGDVEKYFMQTLKELGHDHNIQFQTEAVSINKTKKDRAEVKVKNSKNKIEVIRPSMVIVTDGASSPTRAMLGISRTILAKTTQIAYTTFQPTPSPSIFASLRYRVHHTVRGAVLAVGVAIHAFIFNVSFEKAYGHVVKGGPTAIFRIPEHQYVPGIDSNENEPGDTVPAHDYLIRCLREKEQAFIDLYKDKVETANFKINKTKKKLESPLTKKEKIKLQKRLVRLEQTQQNLKNDLEKVLTSQAQHMHGLLDVLSSLISKNHRIQPMKVERNFLVDIFVGKAEQSLVQVGSTPIILRGDASHTTDPYSGFGCKTALEETLADQFMFSFDELGEMNETILSCQNWAHHFYQETMINQGLRERSLYRSGTELLSRYLDRAVQDRLLTKKEATVFQTIVDKKMLAKSQGKQSFIRFSSVEKDFMQEKVLFLTKHLKKKWESRGKTLKGLDSSWEHRLTRQEAKRLEKMIENLISSSHLVTKKDIEKMKPILGKLAYEGSELAPIIGLFIHSLY